MDKNVIITWLVLGFFAGVIAKYILPGKDKGGLITTTLIGIAGAFVGGFVGNHFGITSQVGGISILSAVTAIVGALILLVALRIVRLLV